MHRMKDDALLAIVQKHASWISQGIPKELLPKRNKLNEFRKIYHDIVKRIIGIKTINFVKPQEFLWEHAIIIDGIISYLEVFQDENTESVIVNYYRDILKKRGKGLTVFSLTDQLMHCQNIYWLIMRGHQELQLLLDDAIHFIKANLNYDGLLPYSQNSKSILYVDALGMIVPFCVVYGKKYDEDLFRIGIKQLKYHIDNAIDEDGLPYHAINQDSGEKLGSSKWGRGLGWMLYALGGISTVLIGEKDSMSLISEYYKSLTSFIINNFPDGIMYNDLQSRDHVDTSVMSMVGVAISEGIISGVLPFSFMPYLTRIKNSLLTYITANGDVMSCSKDCNGIGDTSKEYTSFCAGGPTIKLLSNIQKLNNNV